MVVADTTAIKGGEQVAGRALAERKGNTMADKNSIKDLLTDEIKDLYSAEKQLTKAIPKMAKGSNDAALKAAFTAHLGETEKQVTRLEKAAELLGIKPTGKKCVGMEGCISEGGEAREKGPKEISPLLFFLGGGARRPTRGGGGGKGSKLAGRKGGGHVGELT